MSTSDEAAAVLLQLMRNSAVSPSLKSKQQRLLDVLQARLDAYPPETEADGLRAEAIRRLRVRLLVQR